ncbi:hypothetical protein [Oleiharenicola lentus]|uniref:hypothetical protein n=1 Tax=Oleiharenicola lentus TaxID=2508720 RepID=UPI003F663C46
MNARKLFITAASWEPRFLLGADRVLKDHQFNKVLCLWFTEFGDRTLDARMSLGAKVGNAELSLVELPMYSVSGESGRRRTPAYVTVWRQIRLALADPARDFDSFVLDITTMPREALWITLDLLTEAGLPGTIVYHRAKKHGDWCGSEPELPHIVPKLGGLPTLDLPTRLMIVSGYDEDRSEQFIVSFEPSETLILFQDSPAGTRDENRAKNEERHKTRFGKRDKTISLHGVSCYSADWGFEQMMGAAIKIGLGANLILASLGPKTSAVSLYRVHRNLVESCLIYAPCRNYNPEYSEGIGETLTLEWDSNQVLANV